MKIMYDKKLANHLYEKMKVFLNADGNSKYDNHEAINKSLEAMDKFEISKKYNSVKQVKRKEPYPYYLQKPSISNKIFIPSLRSSGPYISYEDSERLRNKELRSGWIDRNDFQKSFGKASENYANFIKNYVNLDKSPSALSYKFREINRNKWVAKNDFLL